MNFCFAVKGTETNALIRFVCLGPNFFVSGFLHDGLMEIVYQCSKQSMDLKCSIIGKIPPKGVSFSVFICTFTMSCYGFCLFSNRNAKISEKSDMTKSGGNKMLLRNLK